MNIDVLCTSNTDHWRRQWQPTPVLLPGKSHGWRSLEGCSPWDRKESDMTERLYFHALEKAMATHSSVLSWRIPGTGEPGRLPSTGSHRVEHDWSDLAAAATQIINIFPWIIRHLKICDFSSLGGKSIIGNPLATEIWSNAFIDVEVLEQKDTACLCDSQTQTHRLREGTYGYQGGITREFGIDRYTLL